MIYIILSPSELSTVAVFKKEKRHLALSLYLIRKEETTQMF